MKRRVWSANCQVKGVKYGMCSVKCQVWSAKCRVWSVKCKKKCSVECEVV